MTLKEPDVPTVNVVLLPLVIDGAWSTVSVKLCVALVVPFAAVIVIGYRQRRRHDRDVSGKGKLEFTFLVFLFFVLAPVR